ncbi:HER217Cp [Eremothecium sinecaudum]|uniref:HER217Cp n=1 Tax=Eremothecium sinecaudum TaxID=45286 RepID=A0A120K2G9_9SACH|nr:HER217Cp [Eremothecium sinecaudum]AMD21495.1 HER217Cp [Eremothecium sinecaudum]
MSKYAWYTRVTDAVHRLTVLTLVGGTLYMTGGLVYTLYVNGKRYEEKVLKENPEQASSTE